VGGITLPSNFFAVAKFGVGVLLPTNSGIRIGIGIYLFLFYIE